MYDARYHLNELRQKIKFYKDIYRHYYTVKTHPLYTEPYNESGSIPKVIHYSWFGGNEKPEIVKKCMATWQVVLPDYQFKCWNEENFPIERYQFSREALAQKKWVFIADVARVHALYYEGGIYLDTDIEILKSFNDLLDNDVFLSYESPNLLSMGIVGAKKFNPWMGKLLEWFNLVHCDVDYTEIASTRINARITRLLYGIKLDGKEQIFGEKVHLYPREYFNPDNQAGKYLTTKDTYGIHHATKLW